MENYDKALALENSALNSNGKAMQKYAVYQDSIAAKQDRINALAQTWVQNMNFEWVIGELLSLGEAFMKVFSNKLVVQAGMATAAILAFVKATRSLIQKANSFKALIRSPRLLMKKEELLIMNQNWGLAFFLPNEVISIVNKISEQPHTIITFYDCSQGYIPYRLSDLVELYGNDLGTKIKVNRLWHSALQTEEHYIQEIYGRDITKYNYTATGEYVKYGKHVACYVGPVFFTSPRVIVKEITNPSIIACYIEESYINDPQLLPIIARDRKKDSLYLLWAILNSKLATFYHFNHSPKATKGAFPKILVQDIKDFPFPNITKEQKDSITAIVYRILCMKSKDPNADTSALEYEIDNKVYHLYGLTYDEVLIVDQETPITRNEYENN